MLDNDLKSELRQLLSENDYVSFSDYYIEETVLPQCLMEDDYFDEDFFEDIFDFLETNYCKIEFCDDLVFFTKDDYMDILDFVIKNPNVKDDIININETIWIVFFLDKYFLNKNMKELSEREILALGEPKLDDSFDEPILVYNFDLMIDAEYDEKSKSYIPSNLSYFTCYLC